MTIKVMIVDDSAVVRQVVSELVEEASDMTVIKVASDPLIAMRFMSDTKPDVIILDIEMPRMDGLTFLKKVMSENPIPIIICSSLAQKGCRLALEALSSGAVDVITKPQIGVKGFLYESKQQFWRLIRAAASAKIATQTDKSQLAKVIHAPVENELVKLSDTTDRIVAIGTSTGGTTALEHILPNLSRACPGVAVVQHMPEQFTRAFADRLNQLCSVEVKEAENGDRLLPGRVLIAPGGSHLEILRSGAQYRARVFRGPPVKRHCPSVDVLFRSVASCARQNAIGIIMTGMGDDGAQGLLAMKQSGAKTLAQDEASSVVYGMAKEAVKLGAVDRSLSLEAIPGAIH